MFASGAELATTPFLVVVSNGPVPAPLPRADAQTTRQMVSEGRYIADSDRGNISFAPALTQERKKLLHNALVFTNVPRFASTSLRASHCLKYDSALYHGSCSAFNRL